MTTPSAAVFLQPVKPDDRQARAPVLRRPRPVPDNSGNPYAIRAGPTRLGSVARVLLNPIDVPPRFTILIADRNPNVRGFLQREMSREGYSVRPAESADELVRLARGAGPVHLIILDPDLPGASPPALLRALQARLPRVPIVLHTHDPLAARAAAPCSAGPKLIVEKTGSSIVRLKQVAAVLADGAPESALAPKNC